jgi:RecG-like helicase
MSKAPLTINAEVTAVTQFDRVNLHCSALRYPEHFVAITLKGEDGVFYVTFTRKHTQFADSVAIGQRLTVSGKFKRTQDYANLGGQVVITNCVIGQYKFQQADTKREARKAARLAKLGL